ncbi:hypothetical protein [Infirmifilum sp. NZ]|uniref:hypothetical protein n=1 Tax=Infirmifilum sp. NZ TaxID=2926850 RepID=UPI0027A0D480|nr:hypothetical protein [Infirmifilum sp. NZ]UNQ73374.1 hypothetical protein MOV14_09715 [Infirmifilum sp. NZ]
MVSPLELPGARLRLLEALRRRGLYAHMHAYEYILGYRGRIVGVLLVEPRRLSATLYSADKTPEELPALVREALAEVDPSVRLELKPTWEA